MAAAIKSSCLRAGRMVVQQNAPAATSILRTLPARSGIAHKLPLPPFYGVTKGPARELSTSSRLALSASASRQILSPLPQRVEGGVNDPVHLPEPSPTHGSYHWTFERIVSATLIPLTIAPFAAGSLNPITDAVLCGAIIIHSHVGFQSVIIDYLPKKRLPKIRALFWWGLNAGTLLVAVGLYEFETNDVGVTEAIKKIWTA